MKRYLPFAIILGVAAGILASGDDKPKPAPKPARAAAPVVVGVFNVRDYGAVGDATADDTKAIQAAIDDAVGPGDPAKECRRARGTVYIPAGIYKVTAPLRVYSTAFFGLRGEGKSTKLYPSGKMDCVLDLNGVAASTFDDFLIEGTGQLGEEVGDAIYYYQDPPTAAAGSAGNAFSRIWLQDLRCRTGFRIGKPGSFYQVDTTTYRDIWMSGHWKPGEAEWYQNGFAVGPMAWGNNLLHHFYGCTSYGWGTGFNVATTNFSLHGGSLGNNGLDFRADLLSYFVVQGVRSESSRRLYAGGGGPANVTIAHSLNDILWTSSNMDGPVISVNGWNGCLAVRNLDLNVIGKATVDVRPSRSLTLLLDGVKLRGQTLEGFLAGCSPLVDTVVRGFTSEKADGSGWESATKGMALNGPVRWLGGGALDAVAGLPVWRMGDTVNPLAFKSDIPAAPPPVPAPRVASGTGKIPRGQRIARVAHGLGGKPRPEDAWCASKGTQPDVVVYGADAQELLIRAASPAPAAGLDFTWSATLR
jgi:hypothetical protein